NKSNECRSSPDYDVEPATSSEVAFLLCALPRAWAEGPRVNQPGWLASTLASAQPALEPLRSYPLLVRRREFGVGPDRAIVRIFWRLAFLSRYVFRLRGGFVGSP